jgi:(E)-4-hydroxy-3-methylbut-2-enyl-diphosphate synthase
MTDLGFTGGGKGAGMVYVAGKPDHKLDNDRMIEHIVGLVEDKAASMRAEREAVEAAAVAAE